MIRLCEGKDIDEIHAIINDASAAYRGIIPEDRYHEPYMTMEELEHEITSGVIFWGFEDNDQLIGVMGMQDKGEVMLVRHAYVKTNQRNNGIGSKLLCHIMELTDKPILIGTWKTATWAITFYQKNGFSLASDEEKERLLRKYWSIPERQIETSVVLYDRK